MRHRVTSVTTAILFGALLTAALACPDNSLLPPADGKLELGTWGGDSAALIATDSLTHLHIGCTFGNMPGNILLNAAGQFSVDGNYTLHAYPVQVGPSVPARFVGEVRGKILTISVTVNDTVEKKVVELGPATLTLGRTPQYLPCPICLVPKSSTR
ncbi:MAG: hypothetical protein ABJB74_01735 [Gemmatimonas sp.]